MVPAETYLDYHVPGMDGEGQAQEVARVVTKLPGARGTWVDFRTQRLQLWLDEARTPREVLESNLLLLGYGPHLRSGDRPALGAVIHGKVASAETLPGPTPSKDGLRGDDPNGPGTGDHAMPAARVRRDRRRWGLSSTWLAALLVMTTGLGLSAGRTLIGSAGHQPSWPTALMSLAVAAGLMLIAALCARRRADLAWMLSWLAAGALGDMVGMLLDRAAERFLATLLVPLSRGLGGTDRSGADLADLLVLGGVVWLLLALGRRGTPRQPGGR